MRLFVWMFALGVTGAVVALVLGALRAERRPPTLPRVEAEGAARRVISSDGVTLEFARPPRLILPTNASVVDLLDALVGPERIAALPEQAFRWSRLARDRAGYEKHPVFAQYEAETVLDLAPDLVIASAFNNPDTHARLRERGVAVLRLDVRNSLDDVMKALRMLGSLLGVEERAETVCAEIEARRERLCADAADLDGITAVSYSNVGSGGWSFGADSTIDEVFRLAGLRNAAARGGRTGSITMSFEQLVDLDPDLVVMGGDEGQSTSAEVLRGEAALDGLRARRRDAFVILPPELASTSSQEMLTAAEFLVGEVRRLREAGRIERRPGDGR
ncbi:MAG: ABC transporter substrate-binding protein [Planctomycetota bacterium]